MRVDGGLGAMFCKLHNIERGIMGFSVFKITIDVLLIFVNEDDINQSVSTPQQLQSFLGILACKTLLITVYGPLAALSSTEYHGLGAVV